MAQTRKSSNGKSPQQEADVKREAPTVDADNAVTSIIANSETVDAPEMFDGSSHHQLASNT